MNGTIRLLLLFSLLAVTLPVKGNEYLCRNISVDDGLSQSYVTALVRDGRGFLWIGTRFGLNRYDFVSINTYFSDKSNTASLPDNSVTKLFVDSRDSLWIAGASGVSIYCRNNNAFQQLFYDKKQLNARSFYDEGTGVLIGSAGALYFYDFVGRKVAKLQTKGGSKSFYSAIHQWKPGYYILATRWDGLWLYDRTKATITRLPNLPDKRILSSTIDHEGRLWATVFDNGVFCYERDGTARHVLTPADLDNFTVRDIIEKDGEIWLATDGGGIKIYNIKNEQLNENHSDVLTSINAVTQLFLDQHGDVYGGSVRDGAFVIRKVGIHTFSSSTMPGKQLTAVTSVVADKDGRIWIGDDGHGVLVHKEGTSIITPVESTAASKVISLAHYDDNTLLVSTYGKGLMFLDKNTGLTRPVPQALESYYDQSTITGLSMHLLKMSNGKLALISDHIAIFDPANNSIFKPNMLANGTIVPFYNGRGVLMYRGSNFIGEYDAFTGITRVLHTNKDRIYCATFDGDKTVYIGSENEVSALNIFNNSVTPVTVKSSGYISSIAIENGHIWMGINNSLLMKDLGTGNSTQYGRYDGAAANEFMPSATLVTDEYLYMGGVNGLIRIDRNEIEEYNRTVDSAVLSIADLQINGESSYGRINDGHITIDPSCQHLRISVISNGSNPMQRPYYRFIVSVNGHDQVIESYNNFLDLGSFDPGKEYEISASMVNPDGSIGKPQRLLSMTVLAPWYHSRTLWVVMGILMAIGLIIAERHRRRRHAQLLADRYETMRNTTLEKEVAFLINTNYALRTPLTMVYAPVKALIERIRKGEQVELEDELQNIYRNTKRMRDVIDMAMELHQVGSLPDETSHVRHDMRLTIREAIYRHNAEIHNKNIAFNTEAPDTLPEILLKAPDRLKVIMDIFMKRALRRSPANGHILIRLAMTDSDTMRISFTDQGPKLDEKKLEALIEGVNILNESLAGNTFGLAYANSIIETLGGNVGVRNNDAEEAGMTVWMDIPIEHASDSGRRNRHIPDTTAAIPVQEAHLVHVDTSQLTVIVVEEDNDLCMFLSSQLGNHFKRVLHAFNGKDALVMIRQEMPDIVISSILLPFKSGIELCTDIKSNPETSHIPVILLTTIKEGPQLENAYGAGADSYLSKPFDMNVLMMRIRNLFHSRAVMKQRYSNTPSEQNSPAPVSNADESFLLKIDRLIATNIENPDFNVDTIAREMHISRTVLYTKFKAISGKTIAAYINEYRLKRAIEMLRDTTLSINEISESLGFSSQRYFSTFFKERTGFTPTAFRNDNP